MSGSSSLPTVHDQKILKTTGRARSVSFWPEYVAPRKIDPFFSIQDKYKSHPWFWHMNFLTRIALMIIFFILCCCFYVNEEHWTIQQTISFVIVTISTVGYGYRFPTTDRSRVFTIFVILIGVFSVFASLQQFVNSLFDKMKDYLHDRQYQIYKEDDPTTLRMMYVRRLIGMMGILISSLFLAGAFYSVAEGWSFLEGIYFSVETASTVGYGDLPIKHHTTHIFSGFYISIMTTFTAFAFNYMTGIAREQRVIDAFEDSLRLQQETDLMELFEKRSSMEDAEGVCEEEFVLFMLEKLDKIRQKDLDPLQQQFRKLDTELSGQLTRDQLMVYQASIRQDAQLKLENLQSKVDESILTLTDVNEFFEESFRMVSSSFSHPIIPPVTHAENAETDEASRSPLPKVRSASISSSPLHGDRSRSSSINQANESLMGSSSSSSSSGSRLGIVADDTLL